MVAEQNTRGNTTLARIRTKNRNKKIGTNNNQIMKKTILTLALALGLSSAWAAKAWDMPITITQPDGTTITVFQHGDEHFSWYTSLNGTILNRIGNTFIPITESKEAFFAKAARIRKANTIKRTRTRFFSGVVSTYRQPKGFDNIGRISR